MKLTSLAFVDNGKIPVRYTCLGADVPPPLEWTEIPQNTQSFVLICEDPDAPHGTWDHWIVYHIPQTVTVLAENIPLPKGCQEGINSWGNTNYGGPCPPTGTGEHRYFFKLYALDTTLNFLNPPTKRDLESTMKQHIVAQTQLMGRFEKHK